MDDIGVHGDGWVSIGAAAKQAQVDPRTMRRWAESGRVRSRTTPGGPRQVSLGSLRAGYERESFGPRRAQMPSELECAQPETAIPYLAAAAVRWETWKPDDLSVQQCWDLRDEIEALQFALQDIQDGIETSLRSRDEES